MIYEPGPCGLLDTWSFVRRLLPDDSQSLSSALAPGLSQLSDNRRAADDAYNDFAAAGETPNDVGDEGEVNRVVVESEAFEVQARTEPDAGMLGAVSDVDSSVDDTSSKYATERPPDYPELGIRIESSVPTPVDNGDNGDGNQEGQ